MADNLVVPDVVSEELVAIQEADVRDNMRRVQAFLDQLVAQFNSLNGEVRTLSAGGAVERADQISVDRANFNNLLGAFTQTNAQQLFDFIDDLDLTTDTAAVSSFSSNQLQGFTADLTAALDTVIQISYTLTRPSEFTQLRLVMNGIELGQAFALSDQSAVVVNIPVSVRSQIVTASGVGRTITSQLRGTLSDGRTVTSRTRVLSEGQAPQTPYIYPVFFGAQTVAGVPLTDDIRIEVINNQAVFTIPPNTLMDGSMSGFFYPANLTLSRLENTLFGNVDELVAWPESNERRDVNGVTYAVRLSGPIRLRATFIYRAIFT